MGGEGGEHVGGDAYLVAGGVADDVCDGAVGCVGGGDGDGVEGGGDVFAGGFVIVVRHLHPFLRDLVHLARI